jgi:hypothetical protein
MARATLPANAEKSAFPSGAADKAGNADHPTAGLGHTERAGAIPTCAIDQGETPADSRTTIRFDRGR